MVYDAFSYVDSLRYEAAFSLLDVLTLARDKIHAGHTLLTHPLAGSVKPGQTPYKTVLLSKAAGNLDSQSLSIMEDSVAMAYHLIHGSPASRTRKGADKDFQLIDFSLMEDSIKNYLLT